MRRLAMTALVGTGLAMGSAHADDMVARGEYLSRIMDCGGCHTWGAMTPDGPDESRALAGGTIGFEVSGLGVFYPPNLTPYVETGLGGWSDEDIANALRTGVRHDGRGLAPIMPWASYAAITDEDLAALIAYLRSLPPFSYKAPGPFGPSETPTQPFMRVVAP